MPLRLTRLCLWLAVCAALVALAVPGSAGVAMAQPVPGCDPRASLRPLGPPPPPGQMPAGSTMARILARGNLVAGVDQNTYRFGFLDPFNPATGRLEGFDIDVVRWIAEAIFGDPNRVQYRIVINVGEGLETAERGDVDLVVRTTTITCERRERVEFSTVYFEAGQRVLVLRGSGATGIGDLDGRTVCATTGSTSLMRVQQAYPQVRTMPALSATDCLARLQLGEVDAVSSDDAILAGLAAQDPRTEVVGAPFSEEPYGVVVNQNTPDLVRFVNAVLEQRRADGSWEASYRPWLEDLLGPVPPIPVAAYRD